ncbi:MAG: hypothetical protein V4594_01145 [Bacteroidota bacterium]
MKIIKWMTGMLLLNLGITTAAYAQFPFFGDAKKPTGKIRAFTESCYETSTGHQVLVQKERFVYNDQGQLILQTIYDTIDSNKVSYTRKYVYDGKQLLEELAEGQFNVRYLYDAEGNKIARKYTADTLSYLDRYEYDEKNVLTLRNRYNDEGELTARELYTYNGQRQLIRKSYLDHDSASNSKTISYSYESSSSSDVSQERVYAPNGKNLYSIGYFYGMQLDLTEQSRYSAGGNLDWRKTYNYQYDKAENWILMQAKITGGAFLVKRGSFLTRREIEYRK